MKEEGILSVSVTTTYTFKVHVVVLFRVLSHTMVFVYYVLSKNYKVDVFAQLMLLSTCYFEVKQTNVKR